MSRKRGSSGLFERTAVVRNVGNCNRSDTAQRLRRRESSGIQLSSLLLIIIKTVVNFFVSVVIVNDNPSVKNQESDRLKGSCGYCGLPRAAIFVVTDSIHSLAKTVAPLIKKTLFMATCVSCARSSNSTLNPVRMRVLK